MVLIATTDVPFMTHFCPLVENTLDPSRAKPSHERQESGRLSWHVHVTDRQTDRQTDRLDFYRYRDIYCTYAYGFQRLQSDCVNSKKVCTALSVFHNQSPMLK